MSCSVCRQPRSECRCAAPLLAPMPEWRYELQQRVDAYRARRQRPLPAYRRPPAAAPPMEDTPWERPQTGARLQAVAAVPPMPEPPASAGEQASSPTIAPSAWTVVTEGNLATLCAPPAPAVPVTEPAALPPPSAARQRNAACLQLPLPMAPAALAARAPEVAAVPPAARLRAGALDGLVVALAAGVWALAAWAMLGFPPPPPHALRHLLPAIAVAPALLAALYQFLCFYCGGASWGMRHERLCLAAAEAENGAPMPASRSACRRRAWASLISMAALGLGYMWMLCDDQHLAWHDTISGTRILTRDALLAPAPVSSPR